MSKSTIIEFAGRAESPDPVTELLRTSAHQLLYQACGIEHLRDFHPPGERIQSGEEIGIEGGRL